MSCSAAIYAANTNPQELEIGDIINFGSIVRRFGSALNLSGGNVVINGTGYYDIDANINITGTGTGVVTIRLYKDGVPITGAMANVGTASGTRHSISIPAIVRERCCCESVITAVVSGTACTVEDAAIVVAKI